MAFLFDAFGSVKEAQASRTQGAVDKVYADREAQQLDIQAGQEIAVASFNSQRVAERTRAILSEQRAAAAGGGGSTTDGTTSALRAETIRNSSMEQLLTMAEAEEKSNQLKYDATVTRKRGVYAEKLGKDRAQASLIKGTATIIKGVSDWGQMSGGTKPPG